MKTIEEIYEEMLSVFREETGAEASAVSDLSVRLYAVAAQVYGLYAQADWLSRQCFPQTAQGEWLDRHAALRGLERREAARAGGSIRFSVAAPAAADLTIPAGTVCATAGMTRFETTEDAQLKAGETSVLVLARAVEPGAAGNVPAGSILAMAVPPVGIGACVNPEAFTGGADAESDDGLRARVLETYRRMPNGANAAYYEQEALSFPEVACCAVIPRSRGRGTVDVVVTPVPGVSSKTLMAKLQDHFDQRREIAVDVQVRGPSVVQAVIGSTITVAEGYDADQVLDNIRKALRARFDRTQMGKSCLLVELTQAIFTQEGVANCVLTSPKVDIEVGPDEMFAVRAVNLEVAE